MITGTGRGLRSPLVRSFNTLRTPVLFQGNNPDLSTAFNDFFLGRVTTEEIFMWNGTEWVDPIYFKKYTEDKLNMPIPVGGNATAGKFPRFTGTGLTVEETDIESGVDFLVDPPGGNATTGYFPRFTGTGKTIEQVPLLNVQQSVSVGKGGAQFTTIQDAINSITDAANTKQYVINIYPGDYDEQLVLKPYIHYFGVGGYQAVRLTTQTPGSCVTFSGTNFGIVLFNGITFIPGATMSTNTYILFDATGMTSATLTFYGCSIQSASSQVASRILYSANKNVAMDIRNCSIVNMVQLSGVSQGTRIGFDLGTTGSLTIENTPISITASALGNDYIFTSDISTSSPSTRAYSVQMKNCSTTISASNAAFANTVTFLKSAGSYGKFNIEKNSIIVQAGVGNTGTLRLIDSQSTTSNTIDSILNTLLVRTAWITTKVLLNYGTKIVTFNSFQDSWAGHTNVGSGTLTFNRIGAPDSNLFQLPLGTSINEFSIDGTLADDSDTAIPTEQAVKTYADTKPTISSGTSAPSSTPGKIGDIYVDTSAMKLYFSAGNSSSADWIIAN